MHSGKRSIPIGRDSGSTDGEDFCPHGGGTTAKSDGTLSDPVGMQPHKELTLLPTVSS